MAEVLIPLVGVDYRHRAAQLSSQVLQNLYIEKNPDPNQPGVALGFPGSTLFSAGSGADRGIAAMSDQLYQVDGTRLSRINSGGTRSTLGVIPGSGRCIFANDGTNLYIVTGGSIYKWDGAAISTVTQSAVVNPSSIDYINRQFIISGDNGLFATSDVGNGDSYNALNFAEAETSPDALLRVYKFNQVLYMIGAKSTELWYNSGVGNPPFDRQDSTLVNIGCSARHSIANSDQYLYWLGDDNRVYQCLGSSARSISDPAFHSQIEAMETVSDAIGKVMVIEGHVFYVLTFPTGDKTFLFDEDTLIPSVLSYSTTGGRHLMNGHEYIYRKHIISDYRNGNLYYLNKDAYTDNGDIIQRIRTTLPFEMNGRDIVMKKLSIFCEKGVGLASGQGVDPTLMIEVSYDRGKTWSGEIWESLGAMGEYEREIDIYGLGLAQSFTFRFKYTDPTAFHLYKLVAQVEYGR